MSAEFYPEFEGDIDMIYGDEDNMPAETYDEIDADSSEYLDEYYAEHGLSDNKQMRTGLGPAGKFFGGFFNSNGARWNETIKTLKDYKKNSACRKIDENKNDFLFRQMECRIDHDKSTLTHTEWLSVEVCGI